MSLPIVAQNKAQSSYKFQFYIQVTSSYIRNIMRLYRLITPQIVSSYTMKCDTVYHEIPSSIAVNKVPQVQVEDDSISGRFLCICACVENQIPCHPDTVDQGSCQ